MKIKILSALLIILSISIGAFSQTLGITPKKIVYQRKQADLPDYKKSFTITYPKISGVRAALAKKIEASLSYEKTFEFKLKDEIETDTGLDDASFEVLYNKFGILNVLLMEEVSGAYPSDYSKSVVINAKTGAPISAADFFLNLDELAAQVKRAQQTEIKAAIAELRKESGEEDAKMIEERLAETDFTRDNLNHFSVSDQGITFKYDYEFPHVMRALAPVGEFFFSWEQLKPYIRREGLLGRFIR